MLRILAGEKRGMQLRVAHGAAVRPTAGNIRQVLFDILGPRVAGTRWLDLYAGSGAVGLEALSRGATESVLVESARRAIEAIRTNIGNLDNHGRCTLLGLPVEKALKKLAAAGERFDIVFLGPPYYRDEAKRCLLAIGQPPAMLVVPSPDSLVAAQISIHCDVPAKCGLLILEREKRFGDARLCFYRLEPQAIPAGPSAEPEAQP